MSISTSPYFPENGLPDVRWGDIQDDFLPITFGYEPAIQTEGAESAPAGVKADPKEKLIRVMSITIQMTSWRTSDPGSSVSVLLVERLDEKNKSLGYSIRTIRISKGSKGDPTGQRSNTPLGSNLFLARAAYTRFVAQQQKVRPPSA